MSEEHITDKISEEVSVITVFDGEAQRWISMIIGGPRDGYSMMCRENQIDQHATVVKAARQE